MHSQVMQWVCIAALLLALVLWGSIANYQTELNVVVSLAAAVVAIQALQARKYRWATGFIAIALLFNPIVALFRLAGTVGLCLVVLSIAPFAICLVAIRSHPLLSVPSITDRSPGSQSL